MKKLLIISAYNEEKNIVRVCELIQKHNKKYKSNYDFIVINDGSTDNTEKILKKNNIKHIHLITNLGIGGAVQCGYIYAKKNQYDIVVQFDGDGQHEIACVKKIIEPIIKKEAQMVIGSRFIEKNNSSFKSSFFRRIGISVISDVIKFKTKQKIYDTTSGFRAINNDILCEFVKDYPLEYPEPISTAKLLLKNYKIKEIPVQMHPRLEGKSSIASWKNIYYMFNVIVSILITDRKV